MERMKNGDWVNPRAYSYSHRSAGVTMLAWTDWVDRTDFPTKWEQVPNFFKIPTLFTQDKERPLQDLLRQVEEKNASIELITQKNMGLQKRINVLADERDQTAAVVMAMAKVIGEARQAVGAVEGEDWVEIARNKCAQVESLKKTIDEQGKDLVEAARKREKDNADPRDKLLGLPVKHRHTGKRLGVVVEKSSLYDTSVQTSQGGSYETFSVYEIDVIQPKRPIDWWFVFYMLIMVTAMLAAVGVTGYAAYQAVLHAL